MARAKSKSKPKKKRRAAPPPAVGHPAGVPSVAELLAMWQRTREPRVADVLEALAKLVPTLWAPPKSEGKRWRTWANERSPAELPVLLDTHVTERLDVLDRFAPDPRIGRFLVPSIASYRSWSDTPKHQKRVVAMFERLAKHADVDIVERLARISRIHVDDTGYTSCEWFDREIVAVVERLRAEVSPSIADRALIDQCDAWIAACRPKPSGTRAELFAAVYAAPADDGPRAVLADALQQEFLPHGELIALQLAPPTPEIERRIRVMLGRRAGACCAPVVWKMMWVRSVRFERGFIAAGKLWPHSARDLRAAIGAVEWATIHTLEPKSFAGFGSGSSDRGLWLELLTHPAMAHLRRVGPIGIADLAVLVQYGVPVPWRSIAIRIDDDSDAGRLETFLDGERVFGNLACLLVDAPQNAFDKVASTPWLRDVELRVTRELELGDLLDLPR